MPFYFAYYIRFVTSFAKYQHNDHILDLAVVCTILLNADLNMQLRHYFCTDICN